MLKNPIFTVVGLNPLGMIFLYVKELGTQVDEIDMASRSKDFKQFNDMKLKKLHIFCLDS